MGNCCKIKTAPYKYSEPEDGSTHRNDGIVLLSDDCITSISSNSKTWVLSQEFSLSIYTDYSLTSTLLTTDRVRSLLTTESLLIYGGKSISLMDYSGKEREKLIGHERVVTGLSLIDSLLVSGSSDWSLRLWDLETSKELSKSIINWNVATSLQSFEQAVVQTSEDLRLRIWDVRSDLKESLSVSTGNNFATCCDVKGDYIVTGHKGFGGEGCENKLWDKRKLGLVCEMKGHQEGVESVKFVGESVVSCGKDGKLFSFDYQGKALHEWEHKGKKQFVAMDRFKNGVLVGSIEPKVYCFTINPFVHEA